MAGAQQSPQLRAALQPLPDPKVGHPTLGAPAAREKDWKQGLRNLLPALLPSAEVTLQLQEFPASLVAPTAAWGAGLWRALGDFNESHFPAIECLSYL